MVANPIVPRLTNLQCCTIFEHCVSCCISPKNDELRRQVQSHISPQGSTLTALPPAGDESAQAEADIRAGCEGPRRIRVLQASHPPRTHRTCTRALTSSISRLSSHQPDPIEASCAHHARHESANRRHARIAAPAPARIASRASCRTSSKSTVHGNAYMSPFRSPPPRAPPSPL